MPMTIYDILAQLGICVPRDGMVHCVNPAHDDKTPSMCITANGKGFKCFGCGVKGNAQALAELIGMGESEIPAVPIRRTYSHARKPKMFYTLQDLTKWLSATPKLEGYRLTLTHEYRWPTGDLAGVVTRWDSDVGKSYRPLACENGMWRCGKPKVWPIYNAVAVSKSFDTPVFVVEGEKAADKAIELGLVTTTTAGGSNGIASTDLSLLEGRRIIVMPDNDVAGNAYLKSWRDRISNVGAWFLPGLPKGGDIVDFCNGKTNEQALNELRKLWMDR